MFDSIEELKDARNECKSTANRTLAAMALLNQCFCCSLLTGAVLTGVYSAVMYILSVLISHAVVLGLCAEMKRNDTRLFSKCRRGEIRACKVALTPSLYMDWPRYLHKLLAHVFFPISFLLFKEMYAVNVFEGRIAKVHT